MSTEEGFVPIEKIKVGDRVWAEDTVTGKKVLKKVKKIFVREKDSLIRLSVNGEIIETTEEHPFWIKDQGWIPAGSLKAGDIVKLQTGEYVPIETYEVVLLKEPIKVYNFHVEDYECYYVSEQKVLVHNNNQCGSNADGWGKGSFSSSEESLGKHFNKHGKEVGANSPEEYLRKAKEFAKVAKKGSTKSKVKGTTEGVIRYKKNGKYIDLAPNGEIISFGKI